MQGNYWRMFPKQLTKWMPKSQIGKFEETLLKYETNSDQSGNRKRLQHYIIKTHRDKKRVAIFIRKENKLRREEDNIIKLKMSLSNLLLMNMQNKREGISIFKTTLNQL
jgi:hypothetical protein